MTGPRQHVVVMAKLPQAGLVKTRLAKSVGVAEAVRVYRTILSRTLSELRRDPRWITWVAVTPDRAACCRLWPRDVSIVAQGSGNLGVRMQRIMDRLPPGPACVVGSDIPEIRIRHLASAFRALGQHDAVLGPAPDGGFWLVGARRSPAIPRLFENVRWSSHHALADTLCGLAGRRVALINLLTDLDEVADYLEWRKS